MTAFHGDLEVTVLPLGWTKPSTTPPASLRVGTASTTIRTVGFHEAMPRTIEARPQSVSQKSNGRWSEAEERNWPQPHDQRSQSHPQLRSTIEKPKIRGKGSVEIPRGSALSYRKWLFETLHVSNWVHVGIRARDLKKGVVLETVVLW